HADGGVAALQVAVEAEDNTELTGGVDAKGDAVGARTVSVSCPVKVSGFVLKQIRNRARPFVSVEAEQQGFRSGGRQGEHGPEVVGSAVQGRAVKRRTGRV